MTDLHIPAENADPKFAHIRPNVARMLEFVERDSSDLLVISGDLTMQDHSRAECEWLKDKLPGHLNVIIIPGNHDDPALLWQVFGPDLCVNSEFCFSRLLGGFKALFLNTHTDRLPRHQIDYLLREAVDQPALLFLHHPPDLISKGFMAINQPLHNHADVADAIRNSRIMHVFCGHYHNSMEMSCDGFQLHLTPSPAFQVSLQSESFKMESVQPAVRIIEIDDEQIETHMQEL